MTCILMVAKAGAQARHVGNRVAQLIACFYEEQPICLVADNIEDFARLAGEHQFEMVVLDAGGCNPKVKVSDVLSSVKEIYHGPVIAVHGNGKPNLPQTKTFPIQWLFNKPERCQPDLHQLLR